MDEQTTGTPPAAEGRRGWRARIGRRAWLRSAALVGGGLVAGAVLAGTVTATAAGDERGGGSGYGVEDGRDGEGRGHGGRSGGGPGAGEEELTGDTAESLEAAVLAEYPDATIERLETDSDGVYEAHLTTADGDELTVELDEDFAITGTE